MSARVRIEYCTKCRFVLRASWLGQELLMTFGQRLGEVALVPGEGGIFDVWVDDTRVFCKSEEGGFPEAKTLKQRVRDRVAPEMDLGHSDR